MEEVKHTWAELSSDMALVCRREINSEQGNATVWMVLLSDGHLLDCGLSKARAAILATMINEAGPERLSRAAIAKASPPALSKSSEEK
ncbi:hypothetical protein [Phenylobacterium sp. J367]|uniref:hypothetical protein n=1 Tax=Phenylobacterium sp. J367 TaxID=2898435 RepID=UPI0021506F54|nr:hypothetical protein [Phenylobacterium sp. J367]MCR5876965.1 hypothetical protein [Phenylobacterium sp. J367]MCR5877033.1 hypothetical protein [Phenylobacterium sp. J367]